MGYQKNNKSVGQYTKTNHLNSGQKTGLKYMMTRVKHVALITKLNLKMQR